MKLKELYSTSTIIVICVIIATIQAASAAPTISVEPSFQTVSNGENFTVDIYVDPEGNATGGVDYLLYFNNTLLSATSLVSGTFFSGFTTNTYGEGINNSAGTIDYCESILGDGGVTTPGTLTTITFQAIADPGTSELRFNEMWTVLSDPDGIPITTNTGDGSVRITGDEPSTPFLIRGSVSYKDGSECNDPAVNITNLNISKEWTTETNETSNYYQLTLASCADVIAGEILRFDAISPDKSQSSVTEHTVTQAEVDAGGFEYNITLEYRPGDVNGDGKITPADAVIALQMVVCGEYNPVADVNDDKSVTSLDALMILQAAAEST